MSRNTIMLVLAMHILLYVSVFLDISILRQCVGFIFLTFLPGFVIFRALSIKIESVAVKVSLYVSLSVASVMLIGLLVNSLYPLLGISAPLSSLPLMITISAFTLAIFIPSQIRETDINSNKDSQLFQGKINIEGVILCVGSILLLILSIVGALYDIPLLMVYAIGGTAIVFASSVFLYKRVPLRYYIFALFVVSLSLPLQTSLVTGHIMGWDIFREYSVFERVRAAEVWVAPGVVLSYDPISDLNSILSVTILPTVYSTVLNFGGELVFKVIYPFIFCFVPIFLFKTYEEQSGKIVALLSAFFFVAEPMNLYGLAPLSLARETISYLFLSAIIFCFVKQEMDLKTRKFLVLIFWSGLVVSHYSLAFLSLFMIVFVFMAMRVRARKDSMVSLALVLCIFGITFSWYMYVATPPLNNLATALQNVASKLTTDLFNLQNRVDPGMTPLSPTAQAMSLNGLVHKIVVYVSEFFVVVGAMILLIKPNEFKFRPVFRWMAIFAGFLLAVCLVVPNVAPTLNYMRFYRYSMSFLAPLFILGGLYFLGLFRKILSHNPIRNGFVFRDFRLRVLTIILVVFFLFRSGFVNTVTNDYPYSYSLDFDRMKESTFFVAGGSLYNVYVPEQDLYCAKWLALQISNSSLVYADYGMGVTTLTAFTRLNRQNIDYITNGTQQKPKSYIFLRSFNALGGLVAIEQGYFNLSALSPSPTQNCEIYSNGASEVYFAP
jgi:uncharacterized membrane protein